MKSEEFKTLKNKIAFKAVLKIIIYSFISMCAVIFLVDGIFNDVLADFVAYKLDINLYWYFTQNKIIILFIIFFLTFLVVSFFVIRNTGNYLAELLKNLDNILKNTENKIIMSKDLSILEGRMNEIRVNLINSKNNEKEAINRKNDLIMYMAHDLKTPLTSVIGYLSLIKDEKNISKNTQNKYIDIALNKALRVEELTNQFFEITRYNLSEIKLNKEKINLSLLLRQLIDECYPMTQEKNLKLNLDVYDNILILADGSKLARAFENLIKNAINYSFENTVIDIIVQENENIISLLFKNKGEKIPDYKLEKLFEKFYRADEARNTKTGGSGLGLAISKDIIESHDGNISVSINGEFIEFKITLPKNV